MSKVSLILKALGISTVIISSCITPTVAQTISEDLEQLEPNIDLLELPSTPEAVDIDIIPHPAAMGETYTNIFEAKLLGFDGCALEIEEIAVTARCFWIRNGLVVFGLQSSTNHGKTPGPLVINWLRIAKIRN